MNGVDELTIISNRSGGQLRDRVVRAYASKLEESRREKFLGRQNSSAKLFPSGEVYVQLQDNIREHRVHIIAGLYREDLYELRRAVSKMQDRPVREPLLRDYAHSIETDFAELLKILDASRRSGAEKVSVYLSILPDSRQDKKDEPRVSISAKLRFNQMDAASGTRLQRYGVVDLHSKQNNFQKL